MRVVNRTVYVSAREVDDFNSRWPCSTLEGPQSFTFDKSGDLVDRSGKGDGDEAVALSDDCKGYLAAYKRRTRFYVGCTSGRREAFKANFTPTQATHGQIFSAVVGPFKTWLAALWFADHPHSPLCTVNEVEAYLTRKGVKV